MTLIQQPQININRDVVAVLPTGTAFHNDLLMVPVYVHMVYSVATFSILCNVSDGLVLENNSIVINSKWSYKIRQRLPTDISIVAMLVDPSDVTDDPITSPEILFTLAVRVRQTAVTGERQKLSCTVLYISHVLNEKVQLRNMVTPQPATITDYFDNDGFVGEVHIERLQPLAIFPFSQQSHLINTAYVTGTEVSIPVKILVIYESSAITLSTPDTCISLTNSVSINAQCTAIILTGNETHGDELAIVSLQYKGLETNISFRVWFPESPIRLTSTPANLSAVEGWMVQDLSTNSCVQQYQRGKLSAFANFSYSENSPRYEVNVFSLIQSQLVSSNQSVVRISDNGMLVGMQPGECQISAGNNILPLNVHVLAASVQVESLNALLTTGISLNLPTGPYEVLSTKTASAFLLEDFDMDGAKIFVIPGVMFSDGTQYLPTENVIIRSLNQTVLSVEASSDVTVQGSGMAVLQVSWFPECNNSVSLASDDIMVVIDLPDPSHIEVSLDDNRITAPGSLANLAGIATSTSLQVFLVYPDGTRINFSTDDRLQLNLTQANDLINTSISSNRVTIMAARSNGIAIVIVSVSGHTVTTQFNISIVDYSSLYMYATPYPIYNGSDTIRVSQLYQIANTGIYQQASLQMLMILTDNSTITLILPFYISENDTVLVVNGNRASGMSQGRATIRGIFGDQSTTIELAVSDTPVVITRFTEFTLGTDTLSGIKDIHTTQLQVGAVFNDSTVYTALLSNNEALYPGLLAFTSSVPSVALVNVFTGVVTLRNNYYDLVTVTVQSALSTAMEMFRFACNLIAEVGDADLGSQTGIPVPPQTVGTSIIIPIHVNTGGQRLQTLDLIVLVDLDVLEFQSVIPGTDFIPTFNSVVTNQDSKTVSIIGTGVCGSACDVQQLIHIADLNFTAVNTSVVQMSGQIISLTSEGANSPISSNRPFIAGEIDVLIIKEGMRRRRMIFDGNTNFPRTRRQTDCQTIANCSCAEAGDLNKDCVLDFRDAQFLLTYLAEETYNFQLSSLNLTSSQISEFDIDKNGIVDLSDAYILERVSLNLLHLLTNVTIIPVQLNMDCTITVSASFVSRETTNNSLSVFFDFFLPLDRTFITHQQFVNSIFEQGDYIPDGRHLATQGGIVLGEYVSAGQYITRIRTNLTVSNITLNVIQVNQNTGMESSLSPSRVQPMFGFPDPPFKYQNSNYDLPSSSGIVNIPVTYGFNPFMTFDNSLSTAACVNRSGIIPPPVFDSVNYTASVDENQEIGAYVVTVTATTNAFYSIQYDIVFGNGLRYFVIDEITGNITTNSSLNAESSVTEFVLIVTASLQGTVPTISSNTSVFIQVTNVNEAPVILPFENVNINITAPVNSTIVELVIVDPDTSDANYSILAIKVKPASSIFTVFGNTVVVNEPLATGPTINYSANITVIDSLNSNLSSTASFTITVVNISPPAFDMQVYSVNVSESTEVGTNLTTLSVIAPLGSTIVYGIQNFSSQFGIDEISNQLVLLQNFSFELQSYYQFEIEATVTISGESYTATATIEVTVHTDNDTTNETVEFIMNTYHESVPEGSDNGTIVLQVEATFGNSSSMIAYSIVNGISIPFIINNTTGEITVEGLLDYELVQSYTFSVMAVELVSGSFDTASVIINITNINDNPPTIRPQLDTYILLSNTTPDSVIATVQSDDMDGTEDLRYALMDNVIANINDTTGVITSNTLTESLAGTLYSLAVVVTDGRFNDTTNLSVLLLNPVYNLTIQESQFINQSILTLADTTVEDIVYNSTQLLEEFALNFTTGALYQLATLTNSSYQIIINVTSPIKEEQVIVNITVIINNTVTRNNSVPTFSSTVYQASVPVNAPIGTTIIQVNASDVDLDDQLVYSIQSNHSFIGSIDPMTGTVTTTECLPFDTEGSVLNLTVSVTDGQLSVIAFVNIIITSPVNTSSCDAFNFTSEVDIEYNIDGGGLLVNTDQRLTRLVYSQSFSVLTEQSGTLTASIGNKQSGIEYQPERLMGVTVTAILLNNVIYYDDPVIRVALQVRDLRYSTNVQPTTVHIQVTHTNSEAITRFCTANAPTGSCVAEAPLPDQWFTTVANISVDYSIQGNDNTLQSLGLVQISPRVNYTVNYTVALVAPARPLYRRQQFVIPIVAHAGFAVQSYQLLITIPFGFMVNVITVNTSRWSLTQSNSMPNQDGSVNISVLATLLLSVAESITQDMVMTPTDLAQVTLTVQNDITENTEHYINCTVIGLANIFENVLVDDVPPVALWITRQGIERQTGTLYVASDSVMGLLVYSSQSELVYLNNQMQYGVHLLTARVLEGLRVVPPTSCVSSNEEIVTVSNNCQSVSITAIQTEPQYLVNITLSSDSYDVNLPFKIWFPMNYSLLVSDNTISPINGWLDPGNNCAPVYQQSRVRVECVFNDGERSSEVVDVTRYVTNMLQVQNTSVALYQDGHITGITPGMTTLVLQNNGTILASSNITVTSDYVDIMLLDTTAVVSVFLSPPSTVALYETHSVQVSIQDVLEFEGVNAYVAVTALLSDSTRFPLNNNAPGLLISSLDSDIVITGSTPSVVQAGRNSGSGELLEVNITSQNCTSDASVYSQTAFINVSLPRPISASISPSSAQLTKPLDAATMINIPTSVTLRVFVMFENGRTQDITGDDRTVYNVNSGLNVTVDGNVATVRTNPDSTSGQHIITVSFSHVNLSTSATIQVIQAQDIELRAHPFPHYPGSSEYDTMVLYPIANTGLWEQAVISATLLLSDNTSQDISTNNRLTLSINSQPSDLLANIVPINQILNINSVTAAGFIEIIARLGNINSSRSLRVNVSTVPVVVASIDNVYLLSRRDYVTGVRDIGSDQVIVSITLNDTTKYIDLFRAGVRQLPQLLQFATSNSRVLSVNRSTGSLTLHANSRISQTITAKVLNSSELNSTIAVACNLEPAVGDVDLGSQIGLPLSPLIVGSTVGIPVYINAGSMGVASLDIDVFYPSDILQAQDVTLSSLASANPFVGSINDPPGAVSLGGTLDETRARGTVLIATIHFIVVNQTVYVEFTGNVNEFHDINGVLIGEGGRFVAGNVEVDIVSNRRRRTIQHSIPAPPITALKRNRRVTCDDPPCSSCPEGRDVGDTNFDCVLNVQDVTFTRVYITEAPLNFAGSLGHLLQELTDEQRIALDSDHNSVININDAFYLLRVVFGLIRFVSDYTIINEPPECRLQINIMLYSDGRTLTDGSDADKTRLGILVAHNNASFQQAFDTDSLTDNQRLSLSRSSGLIGGIVMASFAGNGIYTVTMSHDIAQYDNIGISLVQITTDDLGMSNLARQIFLRGRPLPPYAYPGRLDVEIDNLSITLLASSGYNPLLSVDGLEECRTSTTVVPTQTATLVSTPVITSITTTTASVPTSSVTGINTTTAISSSLTSTTLLITTSVSMITVAPSSLIESSVVDNTPSSTITPSLPITPSTVITPSLTITPSLPITPSLTITLSLPITPSSTTTTSSVIAPSSTVQVNSSTPMASSITETLSSSATASTVEQTTSTALVTTVTPVVTPSVVIEFPSITPAVMEGMDVKLVDQVEGNASSGFTQDYGLLTAPSQHIMASLAGYQSQVTVQKGRKQATRFKASVLHDDNRVWRDGNTIPVVFQVHDDDWNTRVLLNTTIFMLVTLENEGSTMMYTCRPDENSGMCTINVIFPLEWFDVSSVRQAILTYNNTTDSTMIATLDLQPYATVSSSLNQVVAELPSRSIFPGETFTATVYAYSSFSVNGFTLIFETSSDINILSISIDSSVWSYDDASSNRQYSIAAFSNDPEGSPLNTNTTLLLTLGLQVSQKLVESSNPMIGGTVESLTTIRGPVVLNGLNSTNGPIIMWSRNTQSIIGTIHIVEERPLVLFAVTTSSQIVNTFVLNGVDTTADISLLAGYSTGQLREVTSGLICTNSSISVILIDNQCSTVSASSQQAAYANVTIAFMNVSIDVTFKIWFPQSSMQIILSDSTLNLVEYGNCDMYQKASITVLADFVSGDSTVRRVDVTGYVSSNIISLQPSIANIINTVVTGVTPGETNICVERNGMRWGCTNVSVSSEATTVHDLTAIIVNNIVIYEDPVVNRLLIQTGYSLEIDGDRAGVAVAVQYTDGTIFILDDEEISLQSLNTTVLETEGANIILRNSGSIQLNTTWVPPGCPAGLYSLIDVVLSLQNPIGIRIVSPVSGTVKITPSSDAARHVGIPTIQAITVELLYSNGRTKDVTTDNRTSYIPNNNALVISQSNSGVSVIANNSITAFGVLTVSYMSLMPQVISFRIVRAERLLISAHHYPPYPGSYTDSITTLRLISGTGIRQMVALRLVLELSNNDDDNTIIVTTHSLTSFTLISSTPRTLLGNITISQVNGDIVLNISSSEEGNILVEGMFSTSITNVNKTIELSSVQTSVTILTVNPLPASTLRGQYGEDSVSLTVNVEFDDGSVITDLMPSDLPGLLNFTSLNNSVFVVNELGILSPLANTHTQVTVMVNAVAEDISVAYQFFVNLDPSPGDIDLGDLNEAPIELSSTASSLQVPVYVNTGKADLGAIQVNVQFDPTILQADNVSEGSTWQRGISDYNIDNVAGSVDFGGAIIAAGVRGSRAHIFTINFIVTRPISPLVTTLIGTVETITELSINSNTIGQNTPRPSRAGNVSFLVRPAPVKRSLHNEQAVTNRVTSHKVSKKQAVPCVGSECPAVPGDTNGDDMFDIRDVSYALIYIVEAILDFSSERGMQINSTITAPQLTSLDADLNAVIDITDAIFLLKAVFRLLYLIQDPMISPASPSTSCLVTFSVSLITTGKSAPADDVVVYFDIGLLNNDTHNNFTESTLSDGTIITYNKGDGHFGGIIMAQRISTSQFVASLNSSLVNSVIGLSILQVTFDTMNISRPSRTAQLFGAMNFPLTYPYPLEYTINSRGYNFTVFASHGYNPLISLEIGTEVCTISGPITEEVVAIKDDTLSDTEYAVIAVSLILFVFGILLLVIAIRCSCQVKREKQESGLTANDYFDQEDYYVVSDRLYLSP